ncbi:MAG: AAA family ATPase [Nitrospira sp. BO4]|jgi:RecA-family ATPase|nr:AAA family ATPase [Nitrospira sp. BO4]
MHEFDDNTTHHFTFPDLADRLVSFESIMEEPLPPIEWVVEPLIPRQSRIIVFGEYGSMKSWTLLDLSLHLAAGHPWLDTFEISEPRSVLYIDEEMPSHELRRRVKRMGEGMGLKGVSIPFRAVSHLGIRFTEEKVEGVLTDLRLVGFDPDIIVVETMRRVLVGSENEAAHVAGFWQSATPILVARKTLIVSHHMKKPNPQNPDAVRNRASGSTDILAGADLAYAIIRNQDDSLTIRCEKNRVAPEIEPFKIRMETQGIDDEQSSVIMRYVGQSASGEEERSKMDQAREAILAFLKEQQMFAAKTEAILSHLKQLGIAERTGEQALKDLHEDGNVERTYRGHYRLRPEMNAV